MILSDSPIKKGSEDIYGRNSFAKLLANAFLKINSPVGTVISLNGVWGSGKSSVVNLVVNALTASDDEIVVTRFDGWSYQDEREQALVFLQQLGKSVEKGGLGAEAKDALGKVIKGTMAASPDTIKAVLSVVSGDIGGAAGNAMSVLENFAKGFLDGGTLEEAFDQLYKKLESSNGKRILIVIDDIDRLSPSETIAIFRLIKTLGRLPNVMYLLAYDRNLVEKVVEEKYLSGESHYLDKIIQASFDVPSPQQPDLDRAMFDMINQLGADISDDEEQNFMISYSETIARYVKTPRDVIRLGNAIRVTWSAIKDQISLSDFVVLETLRLNEHKLFKAIALSRSGLCGIRSFPSNSEKDEQTLEELLERVGPDSRIELKKTITRLFPRLHNSFYGTDWLPLWDLNKRVCIERHFDTYFQFSLSEECLSASLIKRLVSEAGDSEFIEAELKKAAKVVRKNGLSLVPVYLMELKVNAKNIEDSHIIPLVRVLFSIFDELNLDRDQGAYGIGIGGTSVGYHHLLRALVEGRHSLDERTELYREVLPGAAFTWLLDFVSLAWSRHNRDDGPLEEARQLVRKDALPEFTEMVVDKVQEMIGDGALIKRLDLMNILYRWRDFTEGNEDVVNWTNGILNNKEDTLALVSRLFGEITTTRQGRRTEKHKVVRLKADNGIVDTEKLRKKLEAIRDDGNSNKDEVSLVTEFLDIWDNTESQDL